MSIKNRINKLESCKSEGFSHSLMKALNRAKERRLDKSLLSTITAVELNEIIAINKENSMAAKIARAKLRILNSLYE